MDAGSAAALWAILDVVVDGYGPVVAELERDIEAVCRPAPDRHDFTCPW
jgi:magnesium transporter